MVYVIQRDTLSSKNDCVELLSSAMKLLESVDVVLAWRGGLRLVALYIQRPHKTHEPSINMTQGCVQSQMEMERLGINAPLERIITCG
jgi:hypothetical protein